MSSSDEFIPTRASLLGRLRARVRLSAKVAVVEALPSGGFLVRLASRDAAGGNGDGEVIRADGVVLAVPPEIAALLMPTAAGQAGTGQPGPAGPRPRDGGMGPEATGGSGGPPPGQRSAPPGQHLGVQGAACRPGPAQWLQIATSPIQTRVERVRLAEFFGGPLDSGDAVRGALDQLRDHLLKLVDEGVKIVVE